ncbi:hypothetical protein F2Q69_00043484 [Brassica cretica]|uniref:Arabidopsis retrotransposon Orf1 C-terminal domain-containing protein n=1 Tax=Brassica cretica TaxID=69181 RepID=A0A8S9N514_BRACR|nr:hypothetical protein F2Q69_00043484 [Brassica cretica]
MLRGKNLKVKSSLRGKTLTLERAGFGTQRTSRQQTVATKKAKEQEKRAEKSIAVATDEESGDESADEQAPTKRAKMSKGKEVDDDRDRAKTPSEVELYHHLLNGVTWTPTRFADLDLLKEVGLDSDIEAMLGHLKMPKLLTMAYPAYRDVSCQFLSSLDTPHTTPFPSVKTPRSALEDARPCILPTEEADHPEGSIDVVAWKGQRSRWGVGADSRAEQSHVFLGDITSLLPISGWLLSPTSETIFRGLSQEPKRGGRGEDTEGSRLGGENGGAATAL